MWEEISSGRKFLNFSYERCRPRMFVHTSALSTQTEIDGDMHSKSTHHTSAIAERFVYLDVTRIIDIYILS